MMWRHITPIPYRIPYFWGEKEGELIWEWLK